jgi:hypothetical protein
MMEQRVDVIFRVKQLKLPSEMSDVKKSHGISEVEVNLRLIVSRPVCPGVRRPPGTHDQFSFLLEISFR